MSPISKPWILFARSDIDAAERLFQSPKPTQWTYLLVLFHCQQAIEKMLKAILAGQEKEILKIHDLPRLAQLTGISFSDEHILLIDRLNKFYLRSRYPDLITTPLTNPKKNETSILFRGTRKLFLWLQQQ